MSGEKQGFDLEPQLDPGSCRRGKFGVGVGEEKVHHGRAGGVLVPG